ncbi:c-type cytochrome [Luteimonas salinilitoris]|uniref:Cytochrome c family protein n=1 Tax=Luteimonas salinilitoris TaxID=3237697 RepID=A0ABV4HT74_9GAMM
MRRIALAACALALSGAASAVDERTPSDAGRGERAFQKCYACHSVRPGEDGLSGPNLAGIVGRRAADRPDFEYSAALLAAARERDLVWTPAALDAFLRDPEAFVPGTSMSFIGIRDPDERAALIHFLSRPAPPTEPAPALK